MNLAPALVTLLVTIGPIDAAAFFIGLAGGFSQDLRRKLAARSVLVAGGMLLLFAFAGNLVLDLMRVSLPAFQVAGGILLFLQALSLTFSRSGLSSLSEGEQREAEGSTDIAVFPMAFPLIAGPGSLTAIVLLMGQAQGMLDRAALVAILLFCLALTLAAMLAGERLIGRLGKTGADVVARISGLLLAAMAVQFAFDGLRSTFAVLR